MNSATRRRAADCADELTGLSPDGFAEAFGDHAAGVALVSAETPRGAVIVVTGVQQLSADPPLFGFTLARASRAAEGMLSAESHVLHLLTADQVGLVRKAEDASGAQLDWGVLYTGEPFVFGAAVWIRGEVVDRIETGDSVFVIAHATHACYPPIGMTQDASWPGPLVRHRGDWHELPRATRLP